MTTNIPLNKFLGVNETTIKCDCPEQAIAYASMSNNASIFTSPYSAYIPYIESSICSKNISCDFALGIFTIQKAGRYLINFHSVVRVVSGAPVGYLGLQCNQQRAYTQAIFSNSGRSYPCFTNIQNFVVDENVAINCFCANNGSIEIETYNITLTLLEAS